MLTKCRAVDRSVASARGASAAAVVDSATRDPGRAVTPSGRPCYRNAGRRVHPSRRTQHSSQAERTSARKNQPRLTLGADPRAIPLRQLTPQSAHAAGAVAGKPGSVPAAGHVRGRWPGNAGSPGRVASAAPPPCSRRCNNDSADAAAQITVHNPSADNDVLDNRDTPLAPYPNDNAMTPDPREIYLPMVKSRSQAPTWLRGALCSAIASTLYAIPSRDPASAHRSGPQRGIGSVLERG